MKLTLLLFSFIVLPFLAYCQSDDEEFYQSNFLRYEDFIYKKTIKTVQLQKDDWEFTAPVIRLGTQEKLKLTFDDLGAESKTYRYTVIHCDANWQPSDRMLPSEYIKGFFDDNIYDYRFSSNTLQNFVHYELIFPTENLRPTVSGNYLLKVFADYDQNDLILTKRFMIIDERINIIPDYHRATIIEESNFKQEIDFTLQTTGLVITNPFQDIKVVLMQNDRWDNAIGNIKPLFVKDNELVYDHDRDNVFAGGNEFRNFDIKSLRWNSERVKNITSDSSKNYHVHLFPDKKRSYLRYMTDRDINGQYKITRQESSRNGSDIEAEYVYVHFTLPMEEALREGSLYVFGELSNWKYGNSNKMTYNKTLKQYEATMYLKQGYYNYQYIFLKDNEKAGDVTEIEGSHFETENDYVIYIYHKPFTSNYDQLIGMRRFNSSRF